MPSTPSSPTSRWHNRTSSSISISTTNRRSSQNSTHSRRSSRTYSLTNTPIVDTFAASPINGDFSSSPVAHGHTLGNLADELAEAWDEDEAQDDVSDLQHTPVDGTFPQSPLSPRMVKVDTGQVRDSGIDVATPPSISSPSKESTSGHKRQLSQSKQRRHSRRLSRRSISFTADKSPLEDDLSPALRVYIAEIEELAKTGSEEQDNVFSRIAELLKNPGGQQGSLETFAARLITAHSSISMNITHQTRTLHSLTYTLRSPLTSLAALPNDESIDEISPLLEASMASMPQSTSEALKSLARLTTSSKDLISTLSSLSDTLQMSRESTATAARRLKSAREVVSELRQDGEVVETGVRWIEDGDWENRLANRDCAKTCREMVQGFEDACESWRQHLALGLAG